MLRVPVLFAALLVTTHAGPARAADPAVDPALPWFTAEQIVLATAIRATSADARIVALARSMEAAHRRMQRRLALRLPSAAADAAVPALSDLAYVEQVLVAHRAQLARCRTACGEHAEWITAVLASRIAMAQAMHHELAGHDRNFYTALESTD